MIINCNDFNCKFNCGGACRVNFYHKELFIDDKSKCISKEMKK